MKTKQEGIEKAEVPIGHAASTPTPHEWHTPQALGLDKDAAARKADDEADDADDEEELEESQLMAEFERMDTDKDNKVSEDEYVLVPPDVLHSDVLHVLHVCRV